MDKMWHKANFNQNVAGFNLEFVLNQFPYLVGICPPSHLANEYGTGPF